MSNSVELYNVTKRFGPKVAVDQLDLVVPDGTIYGFIGPNGSGKTTTLRLIMRIFQPDAGRVVVLGSDRGNVADCRLGYLPEERGLYRRMKVLELVTYFARLKGYYNCRSAVREWLERLGASAWADQKVESLSKGMAQKIQFIVAVIARPKLLVLDEPFAGLDPVNLQALKDAIHELRNEGATIIFSTHDMHVAEQMCDTVFMIFQGRKVLDGTLAEIQENYLLGKLKVRLAGGLAVPGNLPGITSVEDGRADHVLRLAADADPQVILQRLAAVAPVEHFEIVRPTLHDIFVDIAQSRRAN